MHEVEAVSFPNAAGQRLFGTLHRPGVTRLPSAKPLPHVVLLSPGVKMRVGPGRLYVPLTESLVEAGYTVLRFDFFGLGDSEGELDEKMLPDVYNHIEVGRYVDDTLAALAWLKRSQGAKQFVLGGLCGGAITAILAAQREPTVSGLLSLGMTVTLASNAATPGKYLTRAELDERRRGYFDRMFKPQSWWRFITLQSEYSVIWHSMKRMIFKDKPKASTAAPAPAPAATAGVPAAAAAAPEQRGNANPLFPPAFFAFLERGGRALMIFSEKDRLHAEYEEKFAAPYAAQLAAHTAQIDKHVVPNANHVLALAEWQREMVDTSRAWLEKVQAAA